MNQKTVYMVGPISGFSYEEVASKLKPMAKDIEHAGYKVITPLDGKNYLKGTKEFKSYGYANPISTDHAIVRKDLWAVKQADIIFANLTLGKKKVSIGSCMELAWAYYMNKLVITIMKNDNMHYHSFIKESSSIIYEEPEQGIKYLENIHQGIDSI